MVTSLKVANLFLCWANREGDLITNLRMQKLLYYAQAWHLVYFRNALFNETIEAWELGPVVPEAYREFKKFGYTSIKYREDGEEQKPFSSKQLEYLKSCYDTFMKFSAHELVNMTHNESPWANAYANAKSTVIEHKSMQEFYSRMLTQKQKSEK